MQVCHAREIISDYDALFAQHNDTSCQMKLKLEHMTLALERGQQEKDLHHERIGELNQKLMALQARFESETRCYDVALNQALRRLEMSLVCVISHAHWSKSMNMTLKRFLAA